MPGKLQASLSPGLRYCSGSNILLILQKKQYNILMIRKVLQKVQKAVLDLILKIVLVIIYYIGFGMTLFFVKLFKPSILTIKYEQADSFWLKAEKQVQSLEACTRQSWERDNCMNKFKQLAYLVKEILYLVRKNKFYFLAPLMLMLAVLIFLIFYVGPNVVITFIYAGI